METLKEKLGYGCIGITCIILIVLGIKFAVACITGFLVYLFWNHILLSWFPTLFAVTYWQSVFVLFIIYVLFFHFKINLKD